MWVMDVLENQNWTRWRVRPGASFSAGGGGGSGRVEIRVMCTPFENKKNSKKGESLNRP